MWLPTNPPSRPKGWTSWTRKSTTDYKADGLWIADYREAGEPKIKDEWLFHQYTAEPIDKNVAKFKSRDALKEWASSGRTDSAA